MQRRSWLTLLCTLTLAMLLPPQAMADSGSYWNPVTPDESMCQDLTGNWVYCSSLDEQSGGNYTSCMALGSYGQQCQDALVDPNTKQTECAGVWRDGKCNCDQRTKIATGVCIYKAR